jgi:ABC-type multidrug transport system permease subunit
VYPPNTSFLKYLLPGIFAFSTSFFARYAAIRGLEIFQAPFQSLPSGPLRWLLTCS